MIHGYIKVAAAIPSVKVADCQHNIEHIAREMREADEQGAEIIVFPELSVTGYSCQDLFAQQLLIAQAEAAIEGLLSKTKDLDLIAILGAPVVVESF